MHKPVSIYALCDEQGDIRYIGKTVNLKTRLASHRKNKPWFINHIIMETVINGTWVEVERYWIRIAKVYGWPIENRSDGGDGTRGLRLRASHKEKIRSALRGNVNGRWNRHGKETRLIMSIKQKASWTEDRRSKQSGINHAKPCRGKKPWNFGKTAASDSRIAASIEKLRQSHIGQVAWNKGLTKEDPRVEAYASKGTTKFKKGNIPWNARKSL